MARTRTFVGIVIALGALALGGTAVASPPQPVTISVLTVFGNASDPFTSTGGVVCASGSVSTTFSLFTGWQSGRHAQILVGKHFVCPNGTFDALLRVTLSFATGATHGTWSVVAGTGAYRGLHGGGTIVGTAADPGVSIQDEYSGGLHID